VFVPVFAGVIAAMGKAAAASAANTVILAAAQFFSQISVNFLTPVCGTVMGLSVTGAVHPEMSTDKLGELIRKAAVWGLSLLMTVFMSVLSAQTFVTNSADNVLIRTAKFAVSSGVPIVGGTISDAVNTVHASLSLMHSSIGTYGIAAGIVILLPSLISVVCYRFALTAAEAVSEVFGVKELSTLFRACGAVMSIIMAVIVCFLLLNTISVVIMLAAGSSQA
jgi:stage III sporulation protein AE